MEIHDTNTETIAWYLKITLYRCRSAPSSNLEEGHGIARHLREKK
jgi:hypothetical protein